MAPSHVALWVLILCIVIFLALILVGALAPPAPIDDKDIEWFAEGSGVYGSHDLPKAPPAVGQLSECLVNYYKALQRKLLREDPTSEGKTIIQFHHTTWCPHCIRMMVPWSQVKFDLLEKTPEKGNVVLLEKDEDECRTAGVERVPTIIKYSGEKICRYKGSANYDKLKKWILED